MGAKGSVLKRVRQSRRANKRNRHYKSFMKSAIKDALSATNENATEKCKDAVSAIDKVQSRGIIHKNAANRLKSKVMKFANAL